MAITERPTTAVTDRDESGGKVTMVPRARARAAATRRPQPWSGVRKVFAGNSRTDGKGLWDLTPDSLADVVRYTHDGGWVPGDWPWWVEAPGKAYGWLFAVPVTLAAHIALWTIQRPTRLLAVGLLILVLRWTA